MAAAAAGAAAAQASVLSRLCSREVLGDRGVRWVLAGWTLFTVENVIMSEYRVEIRRAWGGGGGKGAYQTLYSSLSAATLGSTILAHWRFSRFGVEVRSLPAPPATRAVAFALRATGLFVMGQIMPPINLGAAPIALGLHKPSMELSAEVRGAMGCPFDFNSQKDRGSEFGVTKITRRPELFGLAAASLGGALVATTATQVAFFGIGPMVSFFILALHSERSQRFSGDLTPEMEATTSLVPFKALLDGRQSWAQFADEVVPVNAWTALGVAVLAAVRPPWLRWVR